MSGLSVWSRSSFSFWLPFVESFLDCDSMGTWTQHIFEGHYPPVYVGCGQFCTGIIAHLRFKCIVSCWFCNRRMHLKTCVYGMWKKGVPPTFKIILWTQTPCILSDMKVKLKLLWYFDIMISSLFMYMQNFFHNIFPTLLTVTYITLHYITHMEIQGVTT